MQGSDRRYLRIRQLIGSILFAALLLWGVNWAVPVVGRMWRPAPTLIVDAPLVESAPDGDNALFAVQGQILYDLPNGKLWTMPLTPDSTPALLFPQVPGTFAFQPVWSVAAQQITYGFIQPDPATGTLTSARLWVANLDGANARQVTQPSPDFPGTYSDPAWSPDGQSIWATVQLPQPDADGVIRLQPEIRVIDVASGAERMVIPNGHSPAIAPDGQSIVYLTSDSETGRTAIWQAAPDGSSARPLVAGEQFQEIYAPMRFSPDGSLLAFAAADAQNQLERTPPARTGWWQRPFLPKRASAHGLYPADIWLLDLERGQLTRLTQLSEDHPTPVWSPDGRHLAFAGVLGVYLIDVAERHAVRITDQGVDGQIEWVGRKP